MDECLPFRLASSSPGAQGAPSALGRLVNDWRRAQAAGCAAPALVQHHIGACVCVRCALSFSPVAFSLGLYVGRTRRVTPHGLPPRISIIELRECYWKGIRSLERMGISIPQRLYSAVPSREGLRAGGHPLTLLIRARRRYALRSLLVRVRRPSRRLGLSLEILLLRRIDDYLSNGSC